MKAAFHINIAGSGRHQVDIEDARAEWGLPDDTYDIALIEYDPPQRIQFEIIGGAQDGMKFEIHATN